MSARTGFVASTSAYLVGAVATLLGGWLSDRLGRRRVNVWGNLVFLVMIYPIFAWITGARSEFALIAGITVLAGSYYFWVGTLYASLAESLPKSIRGSGFGLIYAVAISAFGGATQLVATWLIHVTGSDMAPAWYMIAATALGQIARMLMAESAPVRRARATQPAVPLPR